MFFFVFRLSVMINSTGPEDAICSYSKLLSANWMTPVNTTGHVVFILVSFARLRTTTKTDRPCLAHACPPHEQCRPLYFLNAIGSVWLAGPLGMCPCSQPLTGQWALRVCRERRNVRGIMSERKGGQPCQRPTGTIKSGQSTCWGHSMDSYWVTFFLEHVRRCCQITVQTMPTWWHSILKAFYRIYEIFNKNNPDYRCHYSR